MHLNFHGNMEAFNIEHDILNKQPKHIAYIVDAIGDALGSIKDVVMGTGGSTTKDTMSLTTDEQL